MYNTGKKTKLRNKHMIRGKIKNAATFRICLRLDCSGKHKYCRKSQSRNIKSSHRM